WVGVDGVNVTVPITPLDPATPDQATLSGTITGWDAISVPANHVKAAIAVYSQTDDLGDAGNNLKTANNANICLGGTTCSWSVLPRAGTTPVTVVAAILDIDPNGTPDPSDDIRTIIGWAFAPGVTVQDGVNQSGLALDIVEAGNLQNVTIDLGTPP